MIHLYAMTRAPWPVPVTGIDGQAVDALPVGSLYAVVSRHTGPVAVDTAAAVAHAAVVAAVSEHVPTLPVRFGRGHPDAQTLRAHLSGEVALAELLERVGDDVEFMVRAPGDVPAAAQPVAVGAPSDDGAGRAYLELRRDAARRVEQERARRRRRLAEQTRLLAALAADVVDLDGPRGAERCFLVPRDDEAAFREAAYGLATRAPGLVVGGPWPPFTFAAAEATP